MKKWWGVVGGGILLVGVIVTVVLWPRKFTLSNEYTDRSGVEEISVEEVRTLADEKKSFAVLAYQPGCRTSEDFEKILENFSKERKVTFLRVAFADLKASGLVPELRYYPSMILYRDGKVVDFLKANDDADASAYITQEGFQKWWEKYIQ